ncbi:Ceramide synthase 4, partial [Dissostichus eleginoides]
DMTAGEPNISASARLPDTSEDERTVDLSRWSTELQRGQEGAVTGTEQRDSARCLSFGNNHFGDPGETCEEDSTGQHDISHQLRVPPLLACCSALE